MMGLKFLVNMALITVSCNAATNMRMVDTVQKDALSQRGWAVQRTPAADEQITLQIGLTLQGQDALINKLKEVSDPKGPNYGKYLDKAEVEALAKPGLDAAEKVTRWLKDAGIEAIHADGAWVTFQTSMSKANELLNADFQQYHNDGVSKIRTTSYAVPQDLMEHIDLIHPTTFFGKTQAFRPVHIANGAAELFDEPFVAAVNPIESRQPRSRIDAACKLNITPNCLKQMYNVGDYKPDAASGSKMAFGSFLNETSSVSDLKLFTNKFGIQHPGVNKTSVGGGVDNQQRESGEANLDAQNMVGIGTPLPVYEFITGGEPPFVPDLDLPEGGTNTNEPYLPYYQHLMEKTNAELPQAISNSYGEPEHTVPKNYAMRTCLMIAMMGVRGVSVFESSGDTGIGSNCLSNDGQKRKEFNPQFPGTCPWITSVGGTESVDPEIAWRDSSGGFSYYFERPWYQTDAVGTYLSKYVAPETLAYYKPYFNQAGRGFPDISAHSLLPNYQIYTSGRMRGSGGTSAASPVLAALTAMLNDARLRAAKPTMGFLNPLLYSMGSEFITDITAGKTRGCSGTNFQTGTRFENAGLIPGASWNGTTGWDAATGLGVPDWQKWLATSMKVVGGTVGQGGGQMPAGTAPAGAEKSKGDKKGFWG
ncbi:hypothetical protein FKW77_002859 [Venturia effusa]|uniref:tripeptidyl-peptidase II n=1 Tax=Venturia effusa TaxID=50376 RepID=A0A517LDG5_9PEZI|nr:hypothetical protein FKW77_002859 [Venturia effusa]